MNNWVKGVSFGTKIRLLLSNLHDQGLKVLFLY